MAVKIIEFEDDLLQSLVNCYITAFTTPPWNEYRRCECCERRYGRGAPLLCGSCGTRLTPYHKVEEVQEHFRKVQNLGARLLVVINESDTVIAFRSFGPISLDDYNERKLRIEKEALNCIRHRVGSRVIGTWGLAVLPKWRGQGLGELLLKRSIDETSGPMLSRVFADSKSAVLRLHRKYNFETLHNYADSRRIVVGLIRNGCNGDVPVYPTAPGEV